MSLHSNKVCKIIEKCFRYNAHKKCFKIIQIRNSQHLIETFLVVDSTFPDTANYMFPWGRVCTAFSKSHTLRHLPWQRTQSIKNVRKSTAGDLARFESHLLSAADRLWLLLLRLQQIKTSAFVCESELFSEYIGNLGFLRTFEDLELVIG